MLPTLSLGVLAIALSLRALAAPACFPMEMDRGPEKRAEYLEYYKEHGPGPIAYYVGYGGGGGVRNYCKRSAEALPVPNPEPAPAAEPAPEPEAVVNLDVVEPADVINVSSAYLACYYIYSTARVKRALPGLTENDVEKRRGKVKAKRSADPEPAPAALFNLFPDPDGGAGGGGSGGFDGGTWPGDVGDGFLQCYTVYTTDKRDLTGEGLEKRCGKAKREAEDKVIKREKPKYANYDRYVPV